MIVTIDGSAGSGKSTAARRLAERLHVAHLDTGAMYRAVALRVFEQNIPTNQPEAMLAAAKAMNLGIQCTASGTRAIIDGRDVTDKLRSLEVTRAASAVARVQSIRELLIDQQRVVGESLGSFVTEGRDQGSVVFPDADVKFIIDAEVEVRARRRMAELHAERHGASFEQVLADVSRRDAMDAIQWQPLLDSGSATRIDTTDMTLEEVVARLESLVRESVGQGSRH